MDIESCKHEKLAVKSSVKVDCTTKIVQYCAECNSTRDREIFSVRLGAEGGLTCFSDSVGRWVPSV